MIESKQVQLFSWKRIQMPKQMQAHLVILVGTFVSSNDASWGTSGSITVILQLASKSKNSHCTVEMGT